MNKESQRQIIVVGGGTSGAVLASRLSEDPRLSVTLLEAGRDDDTYHPSVLDPTRASEAWNGVTPMEVTFGKAETGAIAAMQGRIMGGTSAVNGLATLRGQPSDYDGWAALGLEGWGWKDVESTFIALERDADFGDSPLHGNKGPLPVRRWRREEQTRAQVAFADGMAEVGCSVVADINDASQLPGIGVFPVTIDENSQRVTTSLAYLTPAVRARDNLTIRTKAEVDKIIIDNGRATGVTLKNGETIAADEVVVTAGAVWSAYLLLKSGVGPADQLNSLGIPVHADLPVGATLSDHLGTTIRYRHNGQQGGCGGPAQTVLVGASNGSDIDYHVFPLPDSYVPKGSPDSPLIVMAAGLLWRRARTFLKRVGAALHFPVIPSRQTEFEMMVLLLRSSGRGSVRLGKSLSDGPQLTAPPMPEDSAERLTHAYHRLAEWEKSPAARAIGVEQIDPQDLTDSGVVVKALSQQLATYAHFVGTCPMGTVLDQDCCVHGIEGLRVADASVMPTIPAGNTYLGCVMVAERVAQKMIT